jgi:DNA-binding CsgD family transcriptional regulator
MKPAFVDNRALQRVLRLGERRGLRPSRLLRGLPVDPEQAEGRGHVRWDAYCVATERLATAFGSVQALSVLGREMPEVTPEYDEMLSVFGSTRQLFGFWIKLSARIWHSIRIELRDLPDDRVLVRMTIPERLQDCPGLLLGSIGSLSTVPSRIGLDPADVEARIGPRAAHYALRLPKRRPVASRRRIKALDAFISHALDDFALDGRRHLPTVMAEVDEQDALDHAAATWDLTPRQTDVVLWLVRGLSNKEIAAELRCAERTVEVHVTTLLRKARARSRSHLVTRFWRG